MASYLHFMLIRFGLIAAGLVILVLLLFTVALILKRRGHIGAARQRAMPVVRAAAQYVNNRNDRRQARGGLRSRGAITSSALNAAARYLEDGRRGEKR
jgi:hypothetical protein